MSANFSRRSLSKRGEEADSRMSRRKLLATGSGGLVAAAATYASAGVGTAGANQDDEALARISLGPSATGTLVRATSSELILDPYQLDLGSAIGDLGDSSGSELSVELTSGSQLYRSGVVDWSAFEPGDKLVAYVVVVEGRLQALVIEPTFETIETTVAGRAQQRIETKAGTMVLDDATKFEPSESAPEVDSPDLIATGNKIFATCRRESASGDLVAASIAVVAVR